MRNRPPLKGPPRKILVIKPSSLGDIVHSLPFLNSIRECFPKAEIHWVVARPFGPLLEGHPMIDRLWVIDKDKWKKISEARATVAEIGALFRGLRKERFDISIDLQGLLRSGIISAASGAGVRVGLKGFKEGREGSGLFYTHRVDIGKAKPGGFVHAVDRYLKVAEFLGCAPAEIKFPLPETGEVNPSIIDAVSGPYAVLVPGARWPTKRWPSERFGELASRLPVKSVVVGTKEDTGLAEDIVASSGGKAVSLAGRTTLRELITIIRRSTFVVSTDSGPMQIAAALEKPLFALFGPTSPSRTGPYGGKNTIITSDIPCLHCLKKNCGKGGETSPSEEGGTPPCMDDISVDKVYNLVMDAIKKERL